jgi:hypothetical protein
MYQLVDTYFQALIGGAIGNIFLAQISGYSSKISRHKWAVLPLSWYASPVIWIRLKTPTFRKLTNP